MCVCDGGFFDVGRLPERHRQGQGGSYAAALRLTLYKIYAYFIRFSKTNYQFFSFLPDKILIKFLKNQSAEIQNNLKKIQKNFQKQITIFATLNLKKEKPFAYIRQPETLTNQISGSSCILCYISFTNNK